jgi:hypothetical protein
MYFRNMTSDRFFAITPLQIQKSQIWTNKVKHMTRRSIAKWFEALAELSISVTPVKAGVQKCLESLDSGFRRNDAQGLLHEARFVSILW